MQPKTVARRAWLLWREQPLLVLGLLVILVLGTREVVGAVGRNGLTVEEKQLTSTRRATVTAQAIATATALVVQPVLDHRGVGDGETPATGYPYGPWTIGWAYNCRGSVGPRPFSLDLYQATDVSFMHGKVVARGIGPRGSGRTFEQTPAHFDQEFSLLETGPCAWHVRVMRGHRPVLASMPAPDHS